MYVDVLQYLLICQTTPSFKVNHHFDLKHTPVKLGADILLSFDTITFKKVVQN